ncbi:MAG: ABC transporter ATP-binding protein [Ilumatobacteraceae bacterium]
MSDGVNLPDPHDGGDAGELLRVTSLSTRFETPTLTVTAVDDVSLTIRTGHTLGIVGESGSGKSVLSRTIMGLLPPTASVTGTVELSGHVISGLTEKERRRFWGREIAMVFQDPMTSLNPVVRIGRQVAEALPHDQRRSKAEAAKRVKELLTAVRIPNPGQRLRQYPHELSGGMRQRVVIAMALAGNPNLLLADEPTTALDVTVQGQILDLLRSIQLARHMGMILVSHDLGVVAQRTEHVAVMYAGQIVEQAATHDLFANTRMPYTLALLRSIPRMDQSRSEPLQAIGGRPPNLASLPMGCRFASRCPDARRRCLVEAPPLVADANQPDHTYRCWYPVGTAAEYIDRDEMAATPVAVNIGCDGR